MHLGHEGQRHAGEVSDEEGQQGHHQKVQQRVAAVHWLHLRSAHGRQAAPAAGQKELSASWLLPVWSMYFSQCTCAHPGPHNPISAALARARRARSRLPASPCRTLRAAQATYIATECNPAAFVPIPEPASPHTHPTPPLHAHRTTPRINRVHAPRTPAASPPPHPAPTCCVPARPPWLYPSSLSSRLLISALSSCAAPSGSFSTDPAAPARQRGVRSCFTRVRACVCGGGVGRVGSGCSSDCHGPVACTCCVVQCRRCAAESRVVKGSQRAQEQYTSMHLTAPQHMCRNWAPYRCLWAPPPRCALRALCPWWQATPAPHCPPAQARAAWAAPPALPAACFACRGGGVGVAGARGPAPPAACPPCCRRQPAARRSTRVNTPLPPFCFPRTLPSTPWPCAARLMCSRPSGPRARIPGPGTHLMSLTLVLSNISGVTSVVSAAALTHWIRNLSLQSDKYKRGGGHKREPYEEGKGREVIGEDVPFDWLHLAYSGGQGGATKQRVPSSLGQCAASPRGSQCQQAPAP